MRSCSDQLIPILRSVGTHHSTNINIDGPCRRACETCTSSHLASVLCCKRNCISHLNPLTHARLTRNTRPRVPHNHRHYLVSPKDVHPFIHVALYSPYSPRYRIGVVILISRSRHQPHHARILAGSTSLGRQCPSYPAPRPCLSIPRFPLFRNTLLVFVDQLLSI